MWIEETKNGKYKAVERYTDYLTGKQRRVSVTMEKNTSQSRKAAQIALQKKIEAAYQKKEEKKITLNELVKEYLAEQALTVKASTYRRNGFSAKAIIMILGENTLIDKLDANYIRKQFLASEKTPEQMNELLKRFKGIMKWGYSHDMVKDISYLDRLKRFNAVPHKAKIQDKFLESDELKALLSEMKVDLWRNVTHFLALTGLRFGELAALNKSDVDTAERVIRVNKTYDPNNNETTTAKTYTSNREVYIQDELLPIIKNLNLLMLYQRITYPHETEGLFLEDKTGAHIKYYAYNKYLQENANKTLGRKVTAHTLRHTHASLLMEQGVGIDAISRRLGHSDSQITKEIYLHVTKKLKEKDNEQLKNIKIV